jgi:hypothetical protein
MTVSEQNSHISRFYRTALLLMESKGRDYAPEDVVLYDLVVDAVCMGITPDVALVLFLQKHTAALRRFVMHGSLKSEGLASRLSDAANFLALINLLVYERTAIYNGVYAQLERESCTCVADGVWCTRCHSLIKLRGEMTRHDMVLPHAFTSAQQPLLPWD